jgi:hypothetical protein
MAIIKPIMDPFIYDWGHMPRRKSSAVKKLLRAFMKRIGTLTESSRVEKLRSHRPKTFTACSSCGLCPKTDWTKGYFQTAYGILHATYFNRHFMCHSNQPEWKETGIVDTCRLRSCGNMQAIMVGHEKELLELTRQTMNAIMQIMHRPAR